MDNIYIKNKYQVLHQTKRIKNIPLYVHENKTKKSLFYYLENFQCSQVRADSIYKKTSTT